MRFRHYEWGEISPSKPLDGPADMTYIAAERVRVVAGAYGTWGGVVITLLGSDDLATWTPVRDASGGQVLLSADGEVSSADLYNYYTPAVVEPGEYALVGFIRMECA